MKHIIWFNEIDEDTKNNCILFMYNIYKKYEYENTNMSLIEKLKIYEENYENKLNNKIYELKEKHNIEINNYMKDYMLKDQQLRDEYVNNKIEINDLYNKKIIEIELKYEKIIYEMKDKEIMYKEEINKLKNDKQYTSELINLKSDLLNEFKKNNNKGNYGEKIIQNILSEHYIFDTIKDTSRDTNTGDIILIKDNIRINIEVKNLNDTSYSAVQSKITKDFIKNAKLSKQNGNIDLSILAYLGDHDMKNKKQYEIEELNTDDNECIMVIYVSRISKSPDNIIMAIELLLYAYKFKKTYGTIIDLNIILQCMNDLSLNINKKEKCVKDLLDIIHDDKNKIKNIINNIKQSRDNLIKPCPEKCIDEDNIYDTSINEDNRDVHYDNVSMSDNDTNTIKISIYKRPIYVTTFPVYITDKNGNNIVVYYAPKKHSKDRHILTPKYKNAVEYGFMFDDDKKIIYSINYNKN